MFCSFGWVCRLKACEDVQTASCASNHAFGAHNHGFDGDLPVHFGNGVEFADAAPAGQQLDFKDELVAGDDLAFETGFVYAGEEEEFVFLAPAFAQNRQRAARLRHRFDDEYAGHNGQVGEMALELGFVYGDVFDGGQGFHRLEGGDAVELEKRVAVGDEFLDVFGFDGELNVHVFVFLGKIGLDLLRVFAV